MRRTLRRFSLVATLASLGVMTACSRAGQAGAGAPAEPSEPSASPAVVTFTNEGLDQVDVYAVRSSSGRRRLASVAAGRSETFTVPRDLVFSAGPVTIIAVPLASNRVVSTGPITIRPGDRLAITMPVTQNTLTVLPAPPE
jgi:hypothetical protein